MRKTNLGVILMEKGFSTKRSNLAKYIPLAESNLRIGWEIECYTTDEILARARSVLSGDDSEQDEPTATQTTTAYNINLLAGRYGRYVALENKPLRVWLKSILEQTFDTPFPEIAAMYREILVDALYETFDLNKYSKGISFADAENFVNNQLSFLGGSDNEEQIKNKYHEVLNAVLQIDKSEFVSAFIDEDSKVSSNFRKAFEYILLADKFDSDWRKFIRSFSTNVQKQIQKNKAFRDEITDTLVDLDLLNDDFYHIRGSVGRRIEELVGFDGVRNINLLGASNVKVVMRRNHDEWTSLMLVVDISVEFEHTPDEVDENNHFSVVDAILREEGFRIHKVVDDASLQGGRKGVEIISVLFEDFREGMDQLEKIMKYLADEGYQATAGTGIHVSVSFKDKAMGDKVDWLKHALISGVDNMLKELGRSNNRWISQFKNVFEIAYGRYNRMQDFSTKKHDNFEATYINLSRNIVQALSEKYNYVNLSQYNQTGRIEFRLFGGENMFEEADRITQRVYQIVLPMFPAADRNLLRKETFRKLAALLNLNAPANNRGLFSLYRQVKNSDDPDIIALRDNPSKLLDGVDLNIYNMYKMVKDVGFETFVMKAREGKYRMILGPSNRTSNLIPEGLNATRIPLVLTHQYFFQKFANEIPKEKLQFIFDKLVKSGYFDNLLYMCSDMMYTLILVGAKDPNLTDEVNLENVFDVIGTWMQEEPKQKSLRDRFINIVKQEKSKYV